MSKTPAQIAADNTTRIINERQLILTLALMQFVNILDFMMVIPLGPDLAHALGIASSDIGWIGGIYTFSAAITGLIVALYLDDIARKKAAIFCLCGLTLATLAGAFAWNIHSMLAARLIAGMFGGPLASLALAMVADYIPPERRGQAMGKVAGAFAAASVLGVPFGLELAMLISWHAPFVTTALLGLIVTLIASRTLPYHAPYASGRPFTQRFAHLWRLMSQPLAARAFIAMGLTMMSGFMIIPNIAAHIQLNLDYPRQYLGLLYFCGGCISFFSMRGAGWLTDKTSSTRTSVLFTSTLLVAIGLGFVWFPSGVPVLVIFIVFMVSASGRMVAVQTLSSTIPSQEDRGAYMSVQSSVTHLSSAIGSYYASLILQDVDGKLLHVPTIGLSAMAIAICVPFIVWRIEIRSNKLRKPVAALPVIE